MALGKTILNGRLCDVDAPVKTWYDHGMCFNEASRTLPRRQKPDIIMLHWTGGDNGPRCVYDTLVHRGLGCTYVIDREPDKNHNETTWSEQLACIYQMADPVLYDPRDTGGLIGKRSVSLEIINYGFRFRNQTIPRKGRDRNVNVETIHGKRLNVAQFYPHQVRTVAALIKTLCRELDIPLRFPREKDGSLIERVMTIKEQHNWTGIMMHFQKTTKKTDPGLWLPRQLGHMEER